MFIGASYRALPFPSTECDAGGAEKDSGDIQEIGTRSKTKEGLARGVPRGQGMRTMAASVRMPGSSLNPNLKPCIRATWAHVYTPRSSEQRFEGIDG